MRIETYYSHLGKSPTVGALLLDRLRRMHIEPLLLALLLLVMAAGVVILYSASGGSDSLILRQAIRLAVAILAMIMVAQIRLRHLMAAAPAIYVIGLILLLLVLVVGDSGGGATRWLNLGFIRFQPAEIMKLGVPLMLAWLLSSERATPDMTKVVASLLLVLAPLALIFLQPDLGTAVLIGASGAFVLFFSGLKWRYIFGAAAAMAGALPLLWARMHSYQQQRVLTFLNPEADPLGSGYHIIQSKIAIGSGGLFGKGWLQGTQSQLDFLPERSTDFIFSVACEEFGLLGVLPLIALYLAIVLRGLYIAARCDDHFGRMLAAALSLTFFVYTAVNIGMVSGLMPVVGVPLPLISYGGTSMVTLLISFGMIMSIHTHKTQPLYGANL